MKFQWQIVEDPLDPSAKWEAITRPMKSNLRPFHWRLSSPEDARGLWVLTLVCYLQIQPEAEPLKVWLPMGVFQSVLSARLRVEKAAGLLNHEPVAKGLADMLAKFSESREGGNV